MDARDDAALVAHLATRWGGFEDRRRIAADAGLPDAQIAGDATTSWRMLLAEARERGREAKLLQRIAAEDPAVARYLSIGVSALVVKQGVPTTWVAVGVLAGAALLALLALGLYAVGVAGADETVTSPDNLSRAAAAEVAPVAAAAPAPEAPLTVVPSTPNPATTVAAPVATPVAAVTPVPERPVVTPVQVRPVVEKASGGDSVCPEAGADGIIGYTYTGAQRPELKNGAFVASSWLNVRADFPRKENHYSSREKSRCAVTKGMTVSVRDPEVVDGWALWWPVTNVRR